MGLTLCFPHHLLQITQIWRYPIRLRPHLSHRPHGTGDIFEAIAGVDDHNSLVGGNQTLIYGFEQPGSILLAGQTLVLTLTKASSPALDAAADR